MATLLAYGSPSLGHLYPLGALLRELVGRGHRVHLRTMAAGVESMRQLGLRAEPVDPRIEAVDGQEWLAHSVFDALRMSLDVLCERATYEVDDLREAIAAIRPDAVIVDANCWGAISAADAGGLPWAVFSPFTPYLKGTGVPPFGPGLRPMSGTLGRVRDAVMRRIVHRVFDRPMLLRINTIRDELGLAQVHSVDEFMRRSPLLLAVGGEPFEYRCPEWAGQVDFIGACSFEPPSDAAPEWLREIDRPIVLVNMSSIRQADQALGELALAALADEPVHVVATFPAGVPAGLRQPPNATVCRYVPHGPVLDRAVCAVTHGGMGSTLKALARGVPVCVVPFARDQAEVARRVEVAGCGTRLPGKKLTAARLRAVVRQAMTMTEGARRVAEGLAATGGVGRGADLVEQRLIRSDRQASGRA